MKVLEQVISFLNAYLFAPVLSASVWFNRKVLAPPLRGAMWLLDKLYSFVRHSAVITLLFLCAVTAVFRFHDSIVRTVTTWSVFTWAEGIAVLLAILFSQINYDTSVKSIAQQRQKLASSNNNQDDYHLRLALFLDQFFALANFTLFAFAIIVISNPVLHVLFIQAILFAFAINNFFQKRLALRLQTPTIRHSAVIRAMDMHHWLFSENGPGVFGYLLVIALLTCFGHWRESLLDHDRVARFPELLEAVTAGVAGYQISFSTAVYFFFHRYRTGRAFEFEGFAVECNKNDLIDYIRKMGPGWFMLVVAIAFGISVLIVGTRLYARPL